uniref:MIC19 protein n=1 Tax=Anisakis simplex TaxID=6269 RepID=A0A0M3JLW9_ANISI
LFDTSTATQSLTANEENIKRRIRELLEERSELQRNKKMDEQRNNSLREQLERANREAHTAEIERAALHRREKLHLVFVDKVRRA